MIDEQHNLPPKTLEELKNLVAKRRIVFPHLLERVAKHVIDQPETAVFESVTTIADICGVSSATVVRLARYLGFDSFAELRSLLKEHMRQR